MRQHGPKETHTSWLVLALSGVLEAVWATALGKSEGSTRLAPSITFAVSLVLSMAGLAYAMLTGTEPASPLKVLLVVGIIGCVAGLKLLR